MNENGMKGAFPKQARADARNQDSDAPETASEMSVIAKSEVEGSIRVLLVDDEREVREPLAEYLSQHRCRVTQAGSAAGARAALLQRVFDAVVLDIMMPGEDGLSLCRFISEKIDIPVIFLTARAGRADRIGGLELGADDYVVKPFDPRELLARIRAVVRRAKAIPLSRRLPKAKNIRFGEFVLRVAESQLVDAEGVIIPLASRELKLLSIFLEHPNVLLTREQLFEIVNGQELQPTQRSIDNQVHQLRKKIDPDTKNPKYIRTVWGGGYVFSGDVNYD